LNTANLKMTNNDQDLKSWYSVGLVGVGLIGLLAIISMISRSSEYGSQYSQPSIAVPLLLMAATALAFLALKFALKIQNSPKPLLFLIVSVGISLRAIGLFTTPILEIDYYRYIWDGKVTAVVSAGRSAFDEIRKQFRDPSAHPL